uniref:Ribonuclease n=1 Tax=Heterosigma akashiwo TaxID=2829 RepID=A0A6V1NB11_HETAK|mmetsp:Transcript_18487/g.32337  ORF Transcript_18487/g.32337 Transcript_18487/m.32337 type:complete len:306 (+) Transcript_18487:42-959(+)
MAHLQKNYILFKSPVPESCRTVLASGGFADKGPECILGIDEAGRGPVMGPMVYGAAYWSKADDEEISAMGFDDSKALTADQRASLFDKIKETPSVGWVIRSISAEEISNQMLRKVPVSLNIISYAAAMQMIQTALDDGVNITKVYVDTVGDPAAYQERLTRHFKGAIDFTVAKKADSLYKTVSAASICAKVTRDRLLEGWVFPEGPAGFAGGAAMGSGYPSDEKCVAWLRAHVDPVFGFPNIVRFSWGGAGREILEEKAARVEWDEDEGPPPGMQSIAGFLQPANKKRRRAKYFHQRGLEVVHDF